VQGQCSANVINRSVLHNMIRFTTANVLKKAAKQVWGRVHRQSVAGLHWWFSYTGRA
jgi:hypothetical protein